jgi:hypothetical protein
MSAFGLSGFYSRNQPPVTLSRPGQAQVNNILASGAAEGDQRGQMMAMDRGGVSRGAGQRGLAAYQSGAAYGTARANAEDSASDSMDFDRQTDLSRRTMERQNAIGSRGRRFQSQMSDQEFALNMLGQEQARQQALQQYRFGTLTSGWGALTGLLK